MPALLIVRASPTPADRDAFDRWYEAEHLPEAAEGLSPRSARRGWADGDAPLHLAFYEFDTVEAAREAAASDAMKTLARAFDDAFPQVPRRREIIDLVQSL